MESSEFYLARVKELDERFQRLTGREAWGHLSKPKPGVERWAFGDGVVVPDGRQAHEYMSTLVFLAQSDPAKLPYPFDQELTPAQDLRVINGWVDPDTGRARTAEDVEAAREAFRRRR